VTTGCTASERATGRPTPTPSGDALTHDYQLTPDLCTAVDFGQLESAIGYATQPGIEIRAESRSSGWSTTDNFLYTGGVQCWQPYGPTAEEQAAELFLVAATYQSAAGPRIAYDIRKHQDSVALGWLPVGVETMSHGWTGGTYVVYVRDGNLFAEIRMIIYDDQWRRDARRVPPLAAAMNLFANHVMERLRAEFTTPAGTPA
jgi:hypothetical protein